MLLFLKKLVRLALWGLLAGGVLTALAEELHLPENQPVILASDEALTSSPRHYYQLYRDELLRKIRSLTSEYELQLMLKRSRIAIECRYQGKVADDLSARKHIEANCQQIDSELETLDKKRTSIKSSLWKRWWKGVHILDEGLVSIQMHEIENNAAPSIDSFVSGLKIFVKMIDDDLTKNIERFSQRVDAAMGIITPLLQANQELVRPYEEQLARDKQKAQVWAQARLVKRVKEQEAFRAVRKLMNPRHPLNLAIKAQGDSFENLQGKIKVALWLISKTDKLDDLISAIALELSTFWKDKSRGDLTVGNQDGGKIKLPISDALIMALVSLFISDNTTTEVMLNDPDQSCGYLRFQFLPSVSRFQVTTRAPEVPVAAVKFFYKQGEQPDYIFGGNEQEYACAATCDELNDIVLERSNIARQDILVLTEAYIHSSAAPAESDAVR